MSGEVWAEPEEWSPEGLQREPAPRVSDKFQVINTPLCGIACGKLRETLSTFNKTTQSTGPVRVRDIVVSRDLDAPG